MGIANRQSVYNEEMYDCAKKILLEMGAIKECFCGKIFYETYKYDEQNIYAIATKKLKEKFGEQYEYKTYHEQINKVLNDAQDGNNCDCNLTE